MKKCTELFADYNCLATVEGLLAAGRGNAARGRIVQGAGGRDAHTHSVCAAGFRNVRVRSVRNAEYECVCCVASIADFAAGAFGALSPRGKNGVLCAGG